MNNDMYFVELFTLASLHVFGFFIKFPKVLEIIRTLLEVSNYFHKTFFRSLFVQNLMIFILKRVLIFLLPFYPLNTPFF